MTTESDELQIAEPVGQYLIDEPETDTQVDTKPWLFKPGQSGNPAGRPRKGESAQDKLRKQTDRRADKIIDGVLSQAERGNVRAFVSIWDRVYGVPKQSLVIERADDPLTQWLRGMGTIDTPIDVANDLPALPPPSTE